MDSVKEESPDASSDTQLPASFSGKLNLANFAFSPSSKSNLDKPETQNVLHSSVSSPAPSLKRKVKPLPTSPSPRKKPKSQAGYAPPSKYSHLPELQDVLEPGLICVFIGLNPGIATATTGHAYAHPSNLFWKLLHSSGCTTRRMRPEEDGDLPALFSLGNTNIVSRPTRNGSELSRAEMDASVSHLAQKISNFAPEAVCIVGKGIWESIFRVRYGRAVRKEEFKYGWQDEEWEGAKVFVATSTSGLAAGMKPPEKEKVWRELGVWVEGRRAERDAENIKVEVDDEKGIDGNTE